MTCQRGNLRLNDSTCCKTRCEFTKLSANSRWQWRHNDLLSLPGFSIYSYTISQQYISKSKNKTMLIPMTSHLLDYLFALRWGLQQQDKTISSLRLQHSFVSAAFFKHKWKNETKLNRECFVPLLEHKWKLILLSFFGFKKSANPDLLDRCKWRIEKLYHPLSDASDKFDYCDFKNLF